MRKLFFLTLVLISLGSLGDEKSTNSSSKGALARQAGSIPSLTQVLGQSLGPMTAEKKAFLDFLEEEDWGKALIQWQRLFGGNSPSPMEQGLWAYLLVQNGMPVNGLEQLFSVSQPRRTLGKGFLRNIGALLPVDHPAWSQAHIKWNSEWVDIFGPESLTRGGAFQGVEGVGEQGRVFSLLKRVQLHPKERDQMSWQRALNLVLEERVSEASKILSRLLKRKSNFSGRDVMNITVARLLFGKGRFEASIRHYNQVPESSPHWFVSQEEKAWAYMKKGEPQNTLAVLRTLMTPEFASQVGPDGIFLTSLASLKVCDYPQVARSVREYRARFKPKAQKLLELGRKGGLPEALLVPTASVGPHSCERALCFGASQGGQL